MNAQLSVQELRALAGHVEALQARIAQLEYIVGMGRDLVTNIMESTGATNREAQIIGILFKREEIHLDGLTMCLWGHLPFSQQPAEPVATIKTTVFKVRRVLKQYDIEIGTRWGSGYYMTKENKARLQALLDLPA